MSQTSSLYRLQQTDNHIDRSRNRLQDIQKILNDNEQLNIALDKLEKTEQDFAEADRSLHKAEQDVKDLRTKIEQTESNLYGGTVRNPKELEDIQKEVSSLKRYLATLEDRLLEVMIAQEECQKTRKKAQVDVDGLQESIQQQHQVLLIEQDSLEKDIVKFSAERNAILSAIPSEYLDLYTQLKEERRGIAVAGVSENACDVCGAILTPAQIQAARSQQQIIHCNTCGRILYVTEKLES